MSSVSQIHFNKLTPTHHLKGDLNSDNYFCDIHFCNFLKLLLLSSCRDLKISITLLDFQKCFK